MNKIKVGFFSFSAVTDPKEHRSYNEWHQLDHIPENVGIQGIVHGQRWVSPPEYTAARALADPMLAGTQYVTLYLFEEPVEKAIKDFLDMGKQLSGLGRFHRHRQGFMGGPFSLIKGYAAPSALVSPEAIPYRPNRGIAVTVSDVTDRSRFDEIAQWYDQVHVPDILSVKGMAGAYRFVSLAPQSSDAFANPNPADRLINVYYMDEDPMDVAEEMKKHVPEWRAAGHYPDFGEGFKRLFMGSFKTITPWEWDWFDEA